MSGFQEEKNEVQCTYLIIKASVSQDVFPYHVNKYSSETCGSFGFYTAVSKLIQAQSLQDPCICNSLVESSSEKGRICSISKIYLTKNIFLERY